MTSIVLKKGIEEPLASERVARFINSLGYSKNTLKSDTELAAHRWKNAVQLQRRRHTKIRRRTSQEWMSKGQRERDLSRSSTARNTRRRITTNTSLEENKCDKTTVAVATLELLDGIREKAMRIASIGQAAVQKDGSVQAEQ